MFNAIAFVFIVIEKSWLLLFSLTLSSGSIAFGSNFRSGDLDGWTRFEVPRIRKSHF